jgi:hypothetical protein
LHRTIDGAVDNAQVNVFTRVKVSDASQNPLLFAQRHGKTATQRGQRRKSFQLACHTRQPVGFAMEMLAQEPLKVQVVRLDVVANDANASLQCGCEARFARVQLAHQCVTIRHCAFGRGGRCGRAQVGNQVRDRNIDLVANGTDHGNRGGCNRSCHDFFVESPQVFGGATAPTHNDDVGATTV